MKQIIIGHFFVLSHRRRSKEKMLIKASKGQILAWLGKKPNADLMDSQIQSQTSVHS